MNQPTQLAFFFCCLASFIPQVNAADDVERPNILLILCDDLGYADVGFNAKLFGVETDAVTPNIDRLAKAGTIFKQAYVAHPFCGPSRMGLMAGRMPHCFGGQKNLPDVAKNLEDYNQKGNALLVEKTGDTLKNPMGRQLGDVTGVSTQVAEVLNGNINGRIVVDANR